LTRAAGAAQTALPLSQLLMRIANDASRERVTITDLLQALQDRALAALLLIFALPNAIPVPPGTSALLGASRCMNSSGDITKCVVPSRHGVLIMSFNSTCPAALSCTRSSDSAGRVMYRHSCSSRWRSRASHRTAACRLKPSMSAHRGCRGGDSRGWAPRRVSNLCPARGPKAMR